MARSILDHGPSTVADLAARLGLTQAAVRRHLDTLVADDVVEAREQRVYGARTRGRPAKVFALTDCGRDAFDQSYDSLAADAMRWIAQSAGGGERGEAAVAAFARARMDAQAETYRESLEAAPPAERTEALAKALTADGYAATAKSAPGPHSGEQLCQHHCPVAHVAEQFPQLCEAETEVFSRLLGTHVQRLATIAHGDGVCTTFIPRGAGATQTDTSASASTAGRNPA
ncbi:transcriptional regulator [Streptomyces goshikiensis]